MPLYEYTCEDCHQRSELLINGAAEPECPECGSHHLRKAFSTFSTSGDAGAGRAPAFPADAPGCGCSMGPQGPCGLN
ncbi:MAG: zinc ribbon domain-containing protein [Oceanipulchritudo sp.]